MNIMEALASSLMDYGQASVEHRSHPMVTDFQTYYYLTTMLFFDLSPSTSVLTRILFPVLLFFTVWEAQFFNILFAPINFFFLPFLFSLYVLDYLLIQNVFSSVTN